MYTRGALFERGTVASARFAFPHGGQPQSQQLGPRGQGWGTFFAFLRARIDFHAHDGAAAFSHSSRVMRQI